MTKTSPDCDATVLSTSQPNRMGTAAEMQKMYDEVGQGPVAWIIGNLELNFSYMVFFSEENAIEHYNRSKNVLPVWAKIEPVYAALASTPAVPANCKHPTHQCFHYGLCTDTDCRNYGTSVRASTPAVGGLASELSNALRERSYWTYDDRVLLSLVLAELVRSSRAPAVGGEDARTEALRVISTLAICEDGKTAEQRALIVDACREVAANALAQSASPLRGREAGPDGWCNCLPWPDKCPYCGGQPQSASPPEQPAADPVTETEDLYLVWSNEHRCWWNANSCGYTRQVERAGRYDRAEAIEISRGRGWPATGIPDEVPVLERDAIECFSKETQA